jgi:hypothetical protein
MAARGLRANGPVIRSFKSRSPAPNCGRPFRRRLSGVSGDPRPDAANLPQSRRIHYYTPYSSQQTERFRAPCIFASTDGPRLQRGFDMKKDNLVFRDKIRAESMRPMSLVRGSGAVGHALRNARLRLLARSGEPERPRCAPYPVDLDAALSQLGKDILDEPIPARLLQIVKKS